MVGQGFSETIPDNVLITIIVSDNPSAHYLMVSLRIQEMANIIVQYQ